MAVTSLPQVVIPDSSFRKEVEHESGENISSCFQCEKCTNSCPLHPWMDIAPHRIMRCIQMGLKDETLKSDTIWVCASCETCTTRCPNSIDIAHLMDTLRQISQRDGIPASQKSVPIFHNAFLGSIRRHGRVYEGEMILSYKFRDESWRGILNLAGLGLQMFKKGKVKLLPSNIRARGEIKDIFRRAKSKG